MHHYFLTIFFFIIINFFLSKIFKKYTYEKFFIFVVIFFIIINIINIAYIKNINFFAVQIFFSVTILFLYAALYRSVSIKVMVYLYSKEKANLNKYYKKEFMKKSFKKRIKILINNKFLIKKKNYYILSGKGKRYQAAFKTIQLIYKIKYSG